MKSYQNLAYWLAGFLFDKDSLSNDQLDVVRQQLDSLLGDDIAIEVSEPKL